MAPMTESLIDQGRVDGAQAPLDEAPRGGTTGGAAGGSDPRLQSLAGVLEATNAQVRAGHSAGARLWPTGFGVLDSALGGGVRSGELVLLAGPQGLGKTTMGLQMLRNAVTSGDRSAIFFSFEHTAQSVLERLIAIEAAEGAQARALAGDLEDDPISLTTVRSLFEARHSAANTLEERFAGVPGGREAVRSLDRYADRLHLHASSGAHTDVAAIRQAVEQVTADGGPPPFVLVDYLQKVPAPTVLLGEEERITAVVEGLKDIALSLKVPVVAITAAEKSSLKAGTRMRTHHLRGSSALAYEADVILVLNDKYSVVARHHLVYHLEQAERFRQWVVLTIEKNRNGVDQVDLEFLKRFEQGRFERTGRIVSEQLLEERIFTE